MPPVVIGQLPFVETLRETVTRHNYDYEFGPLTPNTVYNVVKITTDVPITDYKLQNLVVNANGTYYPGHDDSDDEDYDAISSVTVNVPFLSGNRTLNRNYWTSEPSQGNYTSLQSYRFDPDTGYRGFSSFTLNLKKQWLNLTSNGTYTPYDNSTIITKITVNVPTNTTTKTITSNGTYNASSDGYDGYSSVTVNVPLPVVEAEKSQTIDFSGLPDPTEVFDTRFGYIYIDPSSGYDAMGRVKLEVGKKWWKISSNGTYNFDDYTYAFFSKLTVDVQLSYSNPTYDFNYDSLNQNFISGGEYGYTDLQTIEFGSPSGYEYMKKCKVRFRRERLYITSNGLYGPHDWSTVLSQVYVNVPQTTSILEDEKVVNFYYNSLEDHYNFHY